MNSKLFIVLGLVLLLVLAGCTTDAEKTAKKKSSDKKSSGSGTSGSSGSSGANAPERTLVRTVCREVKVGVVDLFHIYSDGSEEFSERVKPYCHSESGNPIIPSCIGERFELTTGKCGPSQVCYEGDCIANTDTSST